MNIVDAILKFWPLILLQLVLAIAALLDIRKRRILKRLPRAAWIVIIILGEALGPILYFAVGRGEE